MKDYFVYVLRSDEFKRNYVGFTQNVDQRLADHNAGRTKSTKPFRPWKLLFFERCSNKMEAINRERFLKSGQGRDYIKQKYLAS